MENRYVFNPFWQHQTGSTASTTGRIASRRLRDAFTRAFQASDTARVLTFVFDRLYVLRNQIVHGGSTWNSRVNRAQVHDGAAILGFLMPVFVDLMMDNPA